MELLSIKTDTPKIHWSPEIPQGLTRLTAIFFPPFLVHKHRCSRETRDGRQWGTSKLDIFNRKDINEQSRRCWEVGAWQAFWVFARKALMRAGGFFVPGIFALRGVGKECPVLLRSTLWGKEWRCPYHPLIQVFIRSLPPHSAKRLADRWDSDGFISLRTQPTVQTI